jgi:hypothetical protein
MKNKLKNWCWHTFFSSCLMVLYYIQTTQNHKIVILGFAFLLLYTAVFCVTENKKLPLKSIEFFQNLAIASGFFLLVQFFIMSYYEYEYFFLIVFLVTILRINEEFNNEKLKNNLK